MTYRDFKKSVPQIVYGGVDGTISTFAVIAGAYGAGLSERVAFILGAAAIGSDGFSMAVGAYLSASSAHRKRPRWIGLVTFASFAVLGSLLLIPYVIDQFYDIEATITFVLSGAFALISFAIIGSIKANVDKKPLINGVREVTTLGILAAIIAYLLGHTLEQIII